MFVATAIFALITCLAQRGSSAPIDKRNTEPLVGWVSDPNGRGTAGLVISCVTTLALCVWSAMHLNIPPKDMNRAQRWWRNSRWILLGILIPELVVLSAWRQWLSAKRMTREMKIITKDLELSCVSHKSENPLDAKLEPIRRTSALLRHEWTTVHSMYAGMGGFAFNIDQDIDDEDCFIPKHTELTLTPLGCLILARCGKLPVISLEDIEDKSDSDALGKTVVLVQAGWMVLQTFARLAQNQSVTLLEVNTLGHVFCAFIIYVMWWKKPYGVKEPTMIESFDEPELCAYFYMASRMSGHIPNTKFWLESWVTPELTEYLWHTEKSLDNAEEAAKTYTCSHCEEIETDNGLLRRVARTLSQTEPQSESQIASGLLIAKPGGKLRRLTRSRTTDVIRNKVMEDKLPIEGDSEHKRILRLTLASSALRTYPALLSEFTMEENPADEDSGKIITPVSQQLVAREAPNWPSDFYLPGMAGEVMGIALWFASMGYGAVHIAAWSDFFPTEAERLLWHFSSVYITASAATWLFACTLAYKFQWVSKYWDRFIALQCHWWHYAFWGIISGACGIAYIFARCFLVIDAIASLRRVPQSAYDTPDWSKYIPHL